MVLFDPGVDVTPGLFDVDLPTLAGDAENAQCFCADVILNVPNETGCLPDWEAYSFDVIVAGLSAALQKRFPIGRVESR